MHTLRTGKLSRKPIIHVGVKQIDRRRGTNVQSRLPLMSIDGLAFKAIKKSAFKQAKAKSENLAGFSQNDPDG
jgi:hypothetical protein